MKILAMVLAGGKGTRLHPLTVEHAKPALPFARGYRVVDFVLSNLVNSNVAPIHVLVQHKPQSLVKHIRSAWADWCGGAQAVITIASPESGNGAGAFKGTADAVYRNRHLIERERPDLVAIFAADHVYRMDVRQMAHFHLERSAEVSIAAIPVPIEKASAFGIMATGPAGEILDFQEKPARPAPTATNPRRAYASMGNYLFAPGVLLELLEQADRRGDTDFGHHILPRLPRRHRVFAYDLLSNRIPGVRRHEEPGYWRDIGTIDAYRAAQRDVLGPMPRFHLDNPQWPIHGDAYRARGDVVSLFTATPAGTRDAETGAGANAPLQE